MALKLSTTQISQVPVGKLLADPDQPRQSFEKDALQALADNMKQRGVQVPLLVRLGAKGQIVIKDGERRWRAAKLAKLKTLPCLLVKDDDATQIRMDQVTVNNLRERLKPMELAQTLVRMRDTDKLSANEIAARLAKQGMRSSRAEIESLMKLVALPAWAQTMVNSEQIDLKVAREIAGITDKPVLPKLEALISNALKWRGRVTEKEAAENIREAFETVAAADLKDTNSWNRNPVLFDYRKVCKGCPHLRETHGGAYCMDEAGFARHQDEAKEAGLGPGGVRPKKSEDTAASKDRPLTPAQQRQAEEQKAEQRARSLEDKSRMYLHAWARTRVTARLAESADSSQLRIVLFAAACRPGIPSYELGNASSQHRAEREMRAAAVRAGLPTLQHFLNFGAISNETLTGMATQVVADLPLKETLQLAHHLLGADLAALWKVDADYLDLLQKAELVQVANKHAQLPEGRKSWEQLKTGELVAAIIAVADQVGVPPTLARIYADIERPAREYIEEVGDDDPPDLDDETDPQGDDHPE